MLTRKELQNALKAAKLAGLTDVKLNAKTEVLQAEFEYLANGAKTGEMVNASIEDCEDEPMVKALDVAKAIEMLETLPEKATETTATLETLPTKAEAPVPKNLGGALVELVKLERKAAKLVQKEVAKKTNKYTKNIVETKWGLWFKGQLEYNMSALAF